MQDTALEVETEVAARVLGLETEHKLKLSLLQTELKEEIDVLKLENRNLHEKLQHEIHLREDLERVSVALARFHGGRLLWRPTRVLALLPLLLAAVSASCRVQTGLHPEPSQGLGPCCSFPLSPALGDWLGVLRWVAGWLARPAAGPVCPGVPNGVEPWALC